MADREINLKFTSDTSNAEKNTKKLKKSVDDIGSSKGVKKVNKDLTQTEKKADSIEKKARKIKSNKESFVPEIQETNVTLEKTEQTLENVEKQLGDVNREAKKAAPTSIAFAESINTAFREVIKGGVSGEQAMADMVKQLGVFVQSQAALFAVMLVWTAFEDKIRNFIDQWQELDPTTEKNKQRMQEFAEAVREAGQAAIDAGFAFADKLHSDETNRKADIAIQKMEREKLLLDASKTALENISKARIADMELAARIANDDSALKRLEIENDFINGNISALEKTIALKKLELEAAAAVDQVNLDKAREELKLRQQLNAESKKASENADKTVIEIEARGSRMMSAEEIEKYEADRAAIMKELDQLAEADRVATSEADRVTNQQRRRELQDIWKRLEERRDASGRNTAAEYEAWQRELDAARQTAAALNAEFLKNNKSMYDQQAAVDALAKENKRKKETREKIAAAETKNLQDEEKQAERDKQNQKQIADLKNKLDQMTLEELQAEQRKLQNSIAATKNSKKRARLESRADVYSGAIETRLDRARSTVEKATQGKYASTDAEQDVMTRAATLLEKIAANEQYTRADFNTAKNLLDRATRTTGTADNAVVYQLIDFMNTTATAINKARQQNAKLGNEVARLKNKLSDPSK